MHRSASNMELTHLGFLGALALGATGSGHCALMCGPLAAAALQRGEGRAVHQQLAWHLSRLFAYALLGALAGSVGRAAVAASSGSFSRALPWVMAAGLLLSAFGSAHWLPAIPGLQALLLKLSRLSRAVPPALRAGVLGAATPLLPCGLLHGVVLGALGTGTAGGGALVMAGFAVASAPALLASAATSRALAAHPRLHFVLKRVVPVLAAAVLVWRGIAAATSPVPACH
jgi:sulfite exporter TauE/SafE